jgi:hypothetical protein
MMRFAGLGRRTVSLPIGSDAAHARPARSAFLLGQPPLTGPGLARGLFHALFRIVAEPPRRLAAVAFMVAAAWLPVIPSGASMPRWWAMAVGLPLASPLDPRALHPLAALCLAFALGWALAASFLWSPHPHAAALEWLFLALLCLAATASAGVEEPEPVFQAFGWAVAGSSALALIQLILGPVPHVPTAGGRPAGLFLNPEVLAETAAPILVWSVKHPGAFNGVLAALLASSILVCGSRTAWAAVAFGLLLSWRPDPRWLRPALLAALGIACASASLALGPAKLGSGANRVVLWIAASESITPRGRGLGWWAAGHEEALTEFVHSDALEAMVALGVGALPLFAFFAFALRRDDDGEKNGGKLSAPRCAMAALCLEAVVSFPLHTPAAGFLAFALAGSLARRRDSVRAARRAGGARDLEAVGREAAPGGRVGRARRQGALALPL